MKKKTELKPIITHTMADGSVRKSIEGYVVPVNSKTEIVYDLLLKWALRAKK